MKSKILLLILLLITSSLFAQEIAISGKILSSKDSKPICYASIGISNSYIGTISNDSGDFQLKLSTNYSQDTITVSAIGYKS